MTGPCARPVSGSGFTAGAGFAPGIARAMGAGFKALGRVLRTWASAWHAQCLPLRRRSAFEMDVRDSPLGIACRNVKLRRSSASAHLRPKVCDRSP